MEEARAANQSFTTNFALAFILIASYVTAIATYGLAARTAARRQIETGIRMALGASKADCLKVFLRNGFRTVITGLSIGGGLAILGTYAVLIILPFAINSFEILISTSLSICVVMGILVMLANYFPARKITAMEPGDALRYE